VNAVSGLWVALVVAVVGPAVLSWLSSRQRRAEKREDWARQDAVAAKVDAAAVKAAEAAELLLAANERVAKAAADTNSKLDVIHVLVNSKLTETEQRVVDAMTITLKTMKEVVSLKEQLNVTPSPQSLAHIRETEDRIAELERDLCHKLEQTKAADAAG